MVFPSILCGTYPFRGEELRKVVKESVDIGYRAFDTASKYKNETDLGLVLKESGLNRDEYYISTKLNIDDLYINKWHHKLRRVLPTVRSVKNAYENSCTRLGVEYCDLYLLHYPYPNYVKYWQAMTGLFEARKVKAIGVCSFGISQIESVKNIMQPHVNQIEMHPFCTNKDTLDYCKANGIHVEAFSPFAGGALTKELFENTALIEIGKKYEKSVAQVILRWLIQLGVSPIPRTNKTFKLKENYSLSDFELSKADMKKIDSLDRNQSTLLSLHKY